MESQKIVVPGYLTSDEERELEIELSKIKHFYAYMRRQSKLFQEFKIPFPEFLYEKLKPKSLKYISSFPLQIDDACDFEQLKLDFKSFYSDCRDVKWICEAYEISLPENFWENNKRCSTWKYLELKK